MHPSALLLLLVLFCCALFASAAGALDTSSSNSNKRAKAGGNPTADAKGTNPPVLRQDSDADIAKWRGKLPQNVLARTHRSGRIVAIGDLHGDIDAAKEVFRVAQVTDDAGHWASGTDTVVQMGDVFDRGPHSFLIMDFLARLKQEAHMAGGELLQLLGNHELMNFFGDFRFVHPSLIAAVGGMQAYARMVQRGGRYGALIERLPVAVVRNGTMFVHAGMTELNVRQFGGVDDINAIMRRVLSEQDRGHPIVGEHGPVWTRTNIYSAIAQHKCEPTNLALNALSALEQMQEKSQHRLSARIHRMVVGHTIMTEGEPRSFCNGALFAIDIEMSAYMPGGGYLGYYEQLVQSVEGVQAITLFTLPRGTWAGHPPLWFPQSMDNVSAARATNGGGGANVGEFVHPHDADDAQRKVRMVAVKRGSGGGGAGRLHSGDGDEADGAAGRAFGLFRGTVLLPVAIVALVIAAALYFLVRLRMKASASASSHLAKHVHAPPPPFL